jgi:hypothetical protein
VREVCLAVIVGDFLRRGTRAQQDESCYCDECDSLCRSTLLCADNRSSPTSSKHFTYQTDSLLFRSPDCELLILQTWAVRFLFSISFRRIGRALILAVTVSRRAGCAF